MLVTHGYTSSHHAAGRNPANGNQPGWWDGLIGPGKAIDTDRLFVVASNMLGSSFGSTNGASPEPAHRRALWPGFSGDHGARHRRRAKGAARQPRRPPSRRRRRPVLWRLPGVPMGGRLSRLMMDAIAAVVTAPRSQNAEKSLAELEARLATDPEWHGGHYYGKGGAKTVLTEMRFETLMRYGYGEQLAGALSGPGRARAGDPPARRRLGRELGRELAGDPAPRHARLRHGQGFRQDPGQGALRAVPHRRAVPAETRARRHEGSRRGRGRRPAISSSTAISAIPRAAPSTPNGRRCCASSWRPSSPGSADATKLLHLASTLGRRSRRVNSRNSWAYSAPDICTKKPQSIQGSNFGVNFETGLCDG